ncbi:YmaF family protein [Anaeromicropila herbilytica]|uniref:YmaF family protein n=1 Tax=Anaeromicropila herbilytica TaxID=2785025 RepID=A0A7R7IFR1_9FIRM|nr:YmaF family protein [Anaeromicropila herbilytica]BCN32333.1 hypothetical protein bsdtb5_36280 [Anaeromicropila herbilytica]
MGYNNSQHRQQTVNWPAYELGGQQRCENNVQERVHEHVHELVGSVLIAEVQTDPHNHRFAAVTGEAIQCGEDHYHEVKFRTDYYEGHYHTFCGRSSGAIQVGDRHIHFIKNFTSINDEHNHKFRAATLINDPISENCEG